MDATLHYAFMDESGTVSASTGTHFLVIAVLAVENPRDLEVPVRRALKKSGRDLTGGEIKASRASEKMICECWRLPQTMRLESWQ